MRAPVRQGWWASKSYVEACAVCGCPVQRTPTGTVEDGMAQHLKFVHHLAIARPERAR